MLSTYLFLRTQPQPRAIVAQTPSLAFSSADYDPAVNTRLLSQYLLMPASRMM